MLAKIAGAVLLVWGAIMAFKLILPVISGLFDLIVVLAIGLLAVGVLYMGKRWLDGEGTLGRFIGALVLIAGVALAFKAAMGLVVGVFGALLLMLKVALVLVMLYVGLRWLKNGEFSLRSSDELRA